MKLRWLHGWDCTPREAVALQSRLRGRVLERDLAWEGLRRVAGCDVGIQGDDLLAAVVVFELEGLKIVEQSEARCPARFPYVPGLLSFREAPALLEAFAKLRRRPHAVLCDGQGRAHPRRLGLACHLGLFLDIPTIGVAKSRLVGEAATPGQNRGASTLLRHEGEVIGRLLRTRDSVRPVYVSVGHRITLPDAVRLVLRCGGGYRLPEPTRIADKTVRALSRCARKRPVGDTVG